MKLSRRTLATLALAVVLVASGSLILQKLWFDRAPLSFDPPYPAANAQGDPIFAVYEGRTPCPDCQAAPMVKMMLVLYHNPGTARPTTYWLGLVGTDGNNRTIYQGSWTERRGVAGYPDAVAYQLDSHSPSSRSAYWRVNDDILLVLDQAMTPKPGNSAWGYMLSRYAAPYGPRTYDRRAAL
jgi:hypothetical protein